MTATSFGSSSRLDRGMLVLRVVTGVIFAAHGWQKVFGMGLSGLTAGFSRMGIPVPGFTAPAVGILELVGGIALIVGLFGRWIPFLFVIDMLGAITFVHFKNGFFLPTGYEFTLLLMSASLALALAGYGSMSIDGMIAARRAST